MRVTAGANSHAQLPGPADLAVREVGGPRGGRRSASDQNRTHARLSSSPEGAGHLTGNAQANGNPLVPDTGNAQGSAEFIGSAGRSAAGGRAVARVLGRILQGEILPSAFALLLGVAATLYVRGYNFGESNQTIYLLGTLRASDPWLLQNDWLVSQTTEYHVTFGVLARALMRAGILEGGFLVGYVTLVLLAQLAWLKLVRRLGGTHVTYLVSVLLYYLSNGGLGPGATEMFQDGAFLPSNIANVAMLWGIYLWITGRVGRSAVVFGVAGAFHLNHAIMAMGLWSGLSTWRLLAPGQLVPGASPGAARDKSGAQHRLLPLLAGSIAILCLSLPNLLPVLAAARARSGAETLSLAEYVDTFVRLRAPHHFDPRSWPLTIWLGFLWPMPLAYLAVRMGPMNPARREACRIFVLFCAAIGVSLVGAGIWYFSEPLIQMCFYRFSIFPKLLSCIGAAYWLGKRTLPARRQARFGVAAATVGAVVLGAVVLNSTAIAPLDLLREATRPARALVFLAGVSLVCSCTAVGALRCFRTPFYACGLLLLALQLSAAPRWLGHEKLTPRAGNFLALCEWISDADHTPVDAIFLVPPSEEPFRFEARRAIVVNFKGVPPLRSELPEWRDRLKAVLQLDDLRSLPRGMAAANDAIHRRYESLPANYLASVARTYQARYVLLFSSQAVDPSAVVKENASYRLCDVTKM